MSQAPVRAMVLQLFHEAHAFTPRRVGLADFERRQLLRGEAVRERYGANRNWIGGVLRALDSAEAVTCIGQCAAALPGGPLDAEGFAVLRAGLLDSLRERLAAGPLDLIVLLLHGALVVTGTDDPEADLACAVRALAGPQVRLACAFDFHANLGDTLLASADVVLAGRDYPHTDTAERGARLVELALSAQPGSEHRSRHLRLPLAVPLAAQQTVDGPFAVLYQRAAELQAALALDDLCVIGGFPYANDDRACVSLLATGAAAPSYAALRELAGLARTLAPALLAPLPGPNEVRNWLATPGTQWPRILADAGDNPGAGGTGDDGALLAELLRSGRSFAAGILVDPSLVAAAQQAGPNGSLPLTLTSARPGAGRPQQLGTWTATVERCSPLAWRNRGPMMTGEPVDGGAAAVLRIGRGRLLVATERVQAYDPEAFRSQHIALEDVEVVLVKSSAHFRAGYTALAHGGILVADGGGWSTARLTEFPSNRRTQPAMPWHAVDDAAWHAHIEVGLAREALRDPFPAP